MKTTMDIMDIIKFDCRHCGQSIEIQHGAVGQTFNCPSCNQWVTVPSQLEDIPITQVPPKLPIITNPKRKAVGSHVCLDCESVMFPKSFTKGYFVMELFLWCLLFIPGFCYSLWRLCSRYTGCRVCKSPNIVPINSPAAKRLLS
jgi:predicted RNA-binding Zn-ribbon protein involved in translation (DUF1610 family)